MHHAYLIPKRLEGEEMKNFILGFLKLENEKVEWREFFEDNFKIEMARDVKETISTKPSLGKKRLIILSFLSMNEQAQNTLLKVVEEPGDNNIFIFLTSYPEKILPTINSRVERIKIEGEIQEKKDFEKKSLKEMMKEATKIVEGIKDDKLGKEDALQFMDKVLMRMRKDKADASKLQNLLTLRSYILDQSSSLKQILESAILLAYGV